MRCTGPPTIPANDPREPRAPARLGWLTLALALLWVPGGATAQGIGGGAVDDLRTWLAEHVAHPRFRHARWGVVIESLETGVRVFELNPNRLFVPASNAKLYTGALALDRFGPQFRYRTSLYATTRPDRRGQVEGDLIVYGRGDPTSASQAIGADLNGALAPFAQQIRAAGIRRIRGDLVADESYFRAAPLGSGWEWDDLQYGYAAEVSALSWNDNLLRLDLRPAARPGLPAVIAGVPPGPLRLVNRVLTAAGDQSASVRVLRSPGTDVVVIDGQIPEDSEGYRQNVALRRPAEWFARALREELSRHGVRLDGRTRAVDWRQRDQSPLRFQDLHEIGAVLSPPLKEILPAMLKSSQNRYAHGLLLHVGADVFLRSGGDGAVAVLGATAEQLGIRALEALLDRAGIDAGEVLLEEGSGLSRRNLVTPAATVKLLRFMHRHPHGNVFRQSLPLAGSEGTLRRRMQTGPAAGKTRAKTGYLRHTYALSGYVGNRAGADLVFSIFLNNFRNPTPDGRGTPYLDQIVQRLAGMTQE